MKDKIQDFIQNITIGSKVILDQEYGVLTNCKEHESSTIIRWDTPDEKDFEDWSGLWESFVTMGEQLPIRIFSLNILMVMEL